MIYLVSGNTKERKQYITDTVKEHGALPTRFIHINETDLSDDTSFSDLVVAQSGLFGETETYVIHNLSRSLDLKNILASYQDSPHHIFFSEESVTKPIEKEFQKVDAVVQSFEKEKVQKKEFFNIFALADVLGKRDKKELWIAYQDALKHASIEEIIGVLIWQLKNMMMVYEQPNGVASMKDFVFSKNKRYIQNYRKKEVQSLVQDLVGIFHNRDIHHTLEVQVEKRVLGL